MGWSVLQSNSGTGTTTVSVTYDSNLSSGTKLIAVAVAYGTTTSTVKDGAGNSFTKLAAAGLNGSTTKGELSLWAIDTPAGDAGTTPTVKQTMTASFKSGELLIQEVPGLAAGSTLAAMIDGTPGTDSGNAATAGTLASPSYSSTAADEYLIACYADDAGGSSAITWTQPGALTADPNSFNDTANLALSYGNSAGGTESGGYTVTAAGSPGANWAQILCAFQLAGPALPAPPPVLLVPPGRMSPMASGFSVPPPPPPPLTAYDTDSGTGADTASSIGASSTDTGTGAEAGTISAAVPDADTAGGTDTATVSVSSADTGSGADTASVTLGAADSDSGTGTDAAALSAGLSGADTGTGAETSAISATLAGADSGSEADTALIAAGDSDAGAGADTASTAAAVPGADTGTGAESPAITAAVAGSGAGAGADTATVSVTSADSSTGTDTAGATAAPVVLWRAPDKLSKTGGTMA